VFLIRTESKVSISIIRIMSESPMNAVTVNQGVLSAWGTQSEMSGVKIYIIFYSVYRILSRCVDVVVNLLPYLP